MKGFWFAPSYESVALQNNKWDFFVFICLEVSSLALAAGVTVFRM
jgi:hypothetical protein